jgi:hypothetical protein
MTNLLNQYLYFWVFNVTFNNISIILYQFYWRWRLEYLEKTQRLSHKVVSSAPHYRWESSILTKTGGELRFPEV